VKVGAHGPGWSRQLIEGLPEAIEVAIVGVGEADETREVVARLRQGSRRVLVECTSFEQAELAAELGADGLVAKGHEAGGQVGDETTFILVQRFVSKFRLPVWAHGGVGPHSAAGCHVAGCAGVVLDWQLALARESNLPTRMRAALERFDGQESTCVGSDPLQPFRVYRRPGLAVVEPRPRA
jgi:NAD(P)H-dependent flavin oxidoreductase YrpB (nitropropane dioxygenase family)